MLNLWIFFKLLPYISTSKWGYRASNIWIFFKALVESLSRCCIKWWIIKFSVLFFFIQTFFSLRPLFLMLIVLFSFLVLVSFLELYIEVVQLLVVSIRAFIVIVLCVLVIWLNLFFVSAAALIVSISHCMVMMWCDGDYSCLGWGSMGTSLVVAAIIWGIRYRQEIILLHIVLIRLESDEVISLSSCWVMYGIRYWWHLANSRWK